MFGLVSDCLPCRSPQVQPRRRKRISNIGIGTPSAHKSTHPTLPAVVLRLDRTRIVRLLSGQEIQSSCPRMGRSYMKTFRGKIRSEADSDWGASPNYCLMLLRARSPGKILIMVSCGIEIGNCVLRHLAEGSGFFLLGSATAATVRSTYHKKLDHATSAVGLEQAASIKNTTAVVDCTPAPSSAESTKRKSGSSLKQMHSHCRDPRPGARRSPARSIGFCSRDRIVWAARDCRGLPQTACR